MTRDQLDELIRKAETGGQWAEVCRLEAEYEASLRQCDCCGKMQPRDEMSETVCDECFMEKYHDTV